MKHFVIAIIFFFTLTFQSCKSSLIDYAKDWSTDIKQKIIEDANQRPDKTFFDSTTYNVTLYKGSNKLKFFHLNPKYSVKGQLISIDTAVSIFYSTDQNFELIRELCPVVDRSFEGISYKSQPIGLAEFKYCNGRIKEDGLRFNDDIGVWKEYDSSGKVIRETDHGNINKVQILKDIKYSR